MKDNNVRWKILNKVLERENRRDAFFYKILVEYFS